MPQYRKSDTTLFNRFLNETSEENFGYCATESVI